jgi:hypothetical protein
LSLIVCILDILTDLISEYMLYHSKTGSNFPQSSAFR